MTVEELVGEHCRPLQTELGPVTRRSLASHLGDATGQPRGKGGKNLRAGPPLLRVRAQRAARTSLVVIGLLQVSGSGEAGLNALHAWIGAYGAVL